MQKTDKSPQQTALSALTAAALLLPGLSPDLVMATEEDSVDFQYSHYQEGRRDIDLSYTYFNTLTGTFDKVPVPNNRNPIEVDSVHGNALVSLTDRVKFAFNFVEDTWSGATPIGSAPEHSGANSVKPTFSEDGTPTIVGASPYATTHTTLDSRGQPVFSFTDPASGETSFVKDRAVHVMSYASPETRHQGDFKLGYEWDEAALEIGGGISTERDYESRFVNLGGRMDFNQKQTTVNLGLSYTNSDIEAVLHSRGSLFFNWQNYQDQIEENAVTGLKTLRGNREDWSTRLSLTQVINKNAVAELGMSYTRGSGFMENPYKVSWMFAVDPDNPDNYPDLGIFYGKGGAFVEQRPDLRNQWNWNARWIQYIEPVDAALHLDYQFAHDDWGINAHTFAADWVQPLGAGWTVTPRIRYYSQDAADFYAPYFVTTLQDARLIPPQHFSSDQRLSGYGALSGGLTLAKDFAKGIHLETGIEYYTHQGDLKLGGGGEDSFADFDYWVANAALKVNLSAIGQGGAGGGQHTHPDDHPVIPAGVMFGHTLDKAGDAMVGYRFMHNRQAGEFLHGSGAAPEQQVMALGCPDTGGCSLLPREMTMNMHMLDLMVAPTDWLTLMLMPQFVDMDMSLHQPDSTDANNGGHDHGAHVATGHESGGIGDTGLYALVKLFDTPQHHMHVSLGISAPTGDVGILLKDNSHNLDGNFNHYGMQLGSGTWDLKPSLTYTGKIDEWSWGTQIGGTKRLEDQNKSGYALGDLFETSVWGGYSLTDWLTATVRAAYSWQGAIKGQYQYPRNPSLDGLACSEELYTYADDIDLNGDGIRDGAPYFHQAEFDACIANYNAVLQSINAEQRPSPMDAPSNYGGHYVDVGLGLNVHIPSGAFAGHSLKFEWLQPIYTNVNGYQLDRDGALTFTWGVGF